MEYKALMLGDIIGDSGLRAVRALLPGLQESLGVHFTVANAENASGGFGLTEESAKALFACGIDCLTSGNHIWEKKGIDELLDSEPRLLRPANYPAGAHGSGLARIKKNGALWTVVNLQGRESMSPIDSPFSVGAAMLAGLPARGKPEAPAEGQAQGQAAARPGGAETHCILVDFHAESFDEKESLARYLDGKASAVAGTHTHIQTADERILPGGTGYIGDLGMCGPAESIIGVQVASALQRNLSQMPIRMEVAEGPAFVSAALFTFGEDGACLSVQRLSVAETR